MSGQQTPSGLDYRQNYHQQHNPHPAPVHNPHGGYPAYPGYGPRMGFFRNPLTGGQWLMVIGGAVMVGGLAYYGWVRYKQSKDKQPAAGNPHAVRHLRPVPQAATAAYPRAA